jgi:hypothetical protein
MQAIGDFAAVMDALQDSPVPGPRHRIAARHAARGREALRHVQPHRRADGRLRVLFYSADEQQAMGMGMLQHQLDQFGVTLPKTREEFRHLVETTEVGSPLWRR